MKPLTKLFVFTVLAITIVSCKEEKKPTYIITKKPVEKKVPTGPSKMDNSNWERTVEWLGSPYTLSIVRHSQKRIFQQILQQIALHCLEWHSTALTATSLDLVRV